MSETGRQLTITRIAGPDVLEADLAAHLARRELPDAYLYTGSGGAEAWLDLDGADEFPVARRLTDLLRTHAAAVARRAPSEVCLVGLGVGEGEKERILLEAMIAAGTSPRYRAVDVSLSLVRRALETVAGMDVEAEGVVARTEDLDAVFARAARPAWLATLGNNFSNYRPDVLLDRVAAALRREEAFLFDAHLFPAGGDVEAWRREVDRAYNSPRNAAFNLGPLVRRGMDPGAARFELDVIRDTDLPGKPLRTRKRIIIGRPASVTVSGQQIAFEPGEVIRMGFTYKYTVRQLRALLGARRFEAGPILLSPDETGALVLAHPPPERSRQ